MKTVLITGINGFLGSHLAKKLIHNYNVIGLEYSLENLWRLKGFPIAVYESDDDSIKKIFEQNTVDIIIHMATFYGRNNEEVQLMLNSNFLMPFKLLDYAIKNHSEVFINTDTALDRYVSAYSLTKKQFGDWLIFRKNEIKIINMQLEHFYGPGCAQTNFITSMIQKLKSNETKIDLTAGEQKRDFIYFDDVIDAYELVIDSYQKFDKNYNHFEIGSDEIISIKELMILLKGLTKSDTILNFGAIPYRDNEVMNSSSNLESITKLGWKAKTKIKEGLQKTIGTL